MMPPVVGRLVPAGTAAWPLESSLVAWYARPVIVCTAALSWRIVAARDTQNVDTRISWCEHAGGAGKLLQLPQVLHPAIC